MPSTPSSLHDSEKDESSHISNPHDELVISHEALKTMEEEQQQHENQAIANQQQQSDPAKINTAHPPNSPRANMDTVDFSFLQLFPFISPINIILSIVGYILSVIALVLFIVFWRAMNHPILISLAIVLFLISLVCHGFAISLSYTNVKKIGAEMQHLSQEDFKLALDTYTKAYYTFIATSLPLLVVTMGVCVRCVLTSSPSISQHEKHAELHYIDNEHQHGKEHHEIDQVNAVIQHTVTVSKRLALAIALGITAAYAFNLLGLILLFANASVGYAQPALLVTGFLSFFAGVGIHIVTIVLAILMFLKHKRFLTSIEHGEQAISTDEQYTSLKNLYWMAECELISATIPVCSPILVPLIGLFKLPCPQ